MWRHQRSEIAERARKILLGPHEDNRNWAIRASGQRTCTLGRTHWASCMWAFEPEAPSWTCFLSVLQVSDQLSLYRKYSFDCKAGISISPVVPPSPQGPHSHISPIAASQVEAEATPPSSSTHATGVRSTLGLMVLAVSPTRSMPVAMRWGHRQMAEGTAYGDFSQRASPWGQCPVSLGWKHSSESAELFQAWTRHLSPW